MSGLNIKHDPRWTTARATGRDHARQGALSAIKRWLGLAAPPPARKLDIRRPLGADSNIDLRR